MKKDLKEVRKTLKQTLIQVQKDKISLPKANTITYICSNITRAVIAEIVLNKKQNEGRN